MHIFHKYVNDTQGAIYCLHCRKFKGWKEGGIEVHHDRYWKGSVGYSAWGYILNGLGWKKRKEWEIKQNNGKYE